MLFRSLFGLALQKRDRAGRSLGHGIGKAAALKEKAEGPRRKLVSIIVDAKDADVVAWEPIWLDGAVVGWCTSGGFSHWTGKSVAQGFIPAILAREILIRRAVVNGRAWLNVISVSLCLAFSALYELIEWAVADVFFPAEGVAYLGTQGDVWDTQWDMFLCLCGAATSLLVLSRWHDRQLGAGVLAGK